MADEIVAPGEQIKPQTDLSGAVEIAERLYGIKVSEARELVGYDDKNYHLKVKEPLDNKFISTLWPYGYVLKIMNSSDSKKLDLVDGQCKIMMHLARHGVSTPQPQPSKEGKLYCLEKIQKKNESWEHSKLHVVRLLTYEDGELLRNVPWSCDLNYEFGRWIAKLDLVLKEFFHPVYDHYSSLWMLKNVSKIKEFLFVIDADDQRHQLVLDVIHCFEDNILSRFSTLNLGMIHGDLHDLNLLCKQDGDGKWYISAVLDFGDAHYSAYILELALAIAYHILQSDELETGSHVIAGYCSVHPLPIEELKLLKVGVCARLCQSLVLGLYNFSLDPTNKYVLDTQPRGWRILQQIWGMDSTILERLWFSKLPPDYK